MSAAIHPFPGRDPNLALRLPVDRADDDLLADLAAAVRSHPVAVGGAHDHDDAPVQRQDQATPEAGHRATVTPIAAARRGGANDLVVAERLAGADLRRHRALLAALVVALAVAMALLVGVVGAGADGDVPVAGVTTMEDGDTLWGLASDITPAGGDVRATVALLLEVNDLDSPTVPVGTTIRLPDVAG